MNNRRANPPWDYLQNASLPSLEAYELSRLNEAANLRRQMAVIMDQWIENTAQALLARWVREYRALPRPEPVAGQAEIPFCEYASADAAAAPRETSVPAECHRKCDPLPSVHCAEQPAGPRRDGERYAGAIIANADISGPRRADNAMRISRRGPRGEAAM